MWRHVDKGTAEGVVDAMLLYGQGKQSPALSLSCVGSLSPFLGSFLLQGLVGNGDGKNRYANSSYLQSYISGEATAHRP